ncbi:hypothetical protein CR513_06143, partial [Mucuna pruriens]
MRRKAQGSLSEFEENKGKNGKSKEKDDDDDRVTIATSDIFFILRDFESVYTLKSKDQVLEKFKHFQALVERQSGKKQGIRHEKTPPKTPQLNGLAERMNGTLIKRVRMDDHVKKKLVRSCNVQFMEDQTIEDIDKNGEQHNYVGNQQLVDGFDIPLDDDGEEEKEMSQDENMGNAPEPPLAQLRRSNRQRQLSTRYTSDEYVTLVDGEKLECYQESMESEERKKAWKTKLQKVCCFVHYRGRVYCPYRSMQGVALGEEILVGAWFCSGQTLSKHIDVRYHWIRDALDAKLLELVKVHTDDNGVDMMTKTVPRGKSNLESQTIPTEIETEFESSRPSQLRPKASRPTEGISAG